MMFEVGSGFGRDGFGGRDGEDAEAFDGSLYLRDCIEEYKEFRQLEARELPKCNWEARRTLRYGLLSKRDSSNAENSSTWLMRNSRTVWLRACSGGSIR
jgi:hypothetical protein